MCAFPAPCGAVETTLIWYDSWWVSPHKQKPLHHPYRACSTHSLPSRRAQAMLALANVERAHDRAIESITSTSTICEPAYRSLVQSESQQETLEEPQRNEAAETAKLVEHQQAAMKIVAQHMIQQVDSVTANHEVRMSRLKEQLAGLGHALMEDKMARRAIESQIKESERAHTEQLKSLEEKVRRPLVRENHRQRASSKGQTHQTTLWRLSATMQARALTHA